MNKFDDGCCAVEKSRVGEVLKRLRNVRCGIVKSREAGVLSERATDGTKSSRRTFKFDEDVKERNVKRMNKTKGSLVAWR
jgi:hypothetical protein